MSGQSHGIALSWWPSRGSMLQGVQGERVLSSSSRACQAGWLRLYAGSSELTRAKVHLKFGPTSYLCTTTFVPTASINTTHSLAQTCPTYKKSYYPRRPSELVPTRRRAKAKTLQLSCPCSARRNDKVGRSSCGSRRYQNGICHGKSPPGSLHICNYSYAQDELTSAAAQHYPSPYDHSCCSGVSNVPASRGPVYGMAHDAVLAS